MTDWVRLVLGSGFGGALLYGIVALVKTLAGRKIVQATAADQLADSAVAIIQAVRADAQQAIAQARTNASETMAQAAADVSASRRDADEARRDAAEARREATAARREAMEASASMRRLTTEIMSPTASIERLRLLVEPGGHSDLNGRF